LAKAVSSGMTSAGHVQRACNAILRCGQAHKPE
jgi:hypothetical protein